jgi:hypothetical protein
VNIGGTGAAPPASRDAARDASLANQRSTPSTSEESRIRRFSWLTRWLRGEQAVRELLGGETDVAAHVLEPLHRVARRVLEPERLGADRAVHAIGRDHDVGVGEPVGVEVPE